MSEEPAAAPAAAEPAAAPAAEEPTKPAPQGGREGHARVVWSSRLAFYFAAIGAAVGFGTLTGIC
jgi:hypothetical protein